MLLGRGVVAAADELLLAWLDNESDVSREDVVVELVMAFFDAVADRVATERFARQVRRARCVLS